jgi:hypothetical protein
VVDADDDRGVVLHYLIPRVLHTRIKALAAYKGQTLRVWVTRALAAEADRQDSERAEDERRRRSRR